MLDLGAGTGLLALEARTRVKASGCVVAVDVSADALCECRRQAGPAGHGAPIAYVAGDALEIPLASQSVDVVMTRSVLIYLTDKQAGVRELYRVLKQGGRASIFEPINEVSEQVRRQAIASGFYDALQPEWGEIRQYHDSHAKDWWGTLVGWDERELIGWFEAAGAALRGRPNPNMPSYEEVARLVLGDRADSYLERYAQFLLDGEGPRSASAAVYLVARR